MENEALCKNNEKLDLLNESKIVKFSINQNGAILRFSIEFSSATLTFLAESMVIVSNCWHLLVTRDRN